MDQKSTTCLEALAKLSQQREHQTTPATLCSSEHFFANETIYSDATFLSTTEEAFISSPSSSTQGPKPGLKRVSTGPMTRILEGCQNDKPNSPELERVEEAEDNYSGTSSEEAFSQGIPYPHQVGGHGALSSFERGRVLKPAAKKEIDFYNFIYSDNLPSELEWLRTVTPKYFGQRKTQAKAKRILENQVTPFSQTSSVPVNTVLHIDRKDSERNIWKDQVGELVMDTNPWARACLLKELQKEDEVKSFIILEDLTCHLKKPCVLDCKMGTRHYDDDATEEKKKAHIEKATKTTSSSTGIRFTGMQVYKLPSHTFLFHDKYYGRQLKSHELKNELFEFFHNGVLLRVDIIEQFLSKLQWLYQHLENQHYFNFYSSSLLFVYEGDEMATCPISDVRMIDFAHTQRCVEEQQNDGYLFGLSNLIHLMKSLLEDERNEMR
ncbi:Inositol hexakisphosphate kinase 3 [Galdieria sulphuraria]|uniref:Kinase n=1 Tax=Galdieria sulphuraria TaxID=130081 RepID=M2WS09_GALSU|nr:inositol-hexakisphosphate kinase [Galdieria sulphuraria]EME26625.1 inositol-hexakisphosphate kinase [Galdieria sulphuraria]GJD08723.1 Inositol hexakisphosphate kinase 3 [Galdieria sulphuraria]|eukprot:XP_005703145.1 inositol-hexakisphosphate kinase [Galdieria sulphuraria]